MSDNNCDSGSKAPLHWYAKQRNCLWVALLLWLVPFLVISTMVALRPEKHTVTPVYSTASANWWAGEDLYDGADGFYYLPHFAVIYTPFEALPSPVGDILWRALGLGLLALGMWRVLRKGFPEQSVQLFMWASLLALPVGLGAVRNGQANSIFAGVILNAVACLFYKEWWRAAALMGVAFLLKPLAIVLVLLAPVVYAPLRFRIVLVGIACVIFPFLFANPHYVIAQHRAFASKMDTSAGVTENRFADINGIIRAFGLELPEKVSKLMRVAAGGITLVLVFLGCRRSPELARMLWLYALTTGYLMLFNPMTEHNSYIILAPALALWAVGMIYSGNGRRLGWVIVWITVSMALLPTLLRPLFGSRFPLFWSPLVAIIFLGAATWHVFGHKTHLGESPIENS